MEGVLSNITISEFFPTTMLDEQQSKKIKLQNSSYNNISEKYKRESEKNTVSKFSKQVLQEEVKKQSTFTNEVIKESVSLPALKDVIELVRYQEQPPVKIGEYRPIKISTSMEANIISKYNIEESSEAEKTTDDYKINFSDTNIIFKANKKYADINLNDSNEAEEDNEVVVIPERDYDVKSENSDNDETTVADSNEEKNAEYSYEEESNSNENSDLADNSTDDHNENSETKSDYSELIEKLKQERDAAAQRVKNANNNYNETKVKLAEAADRYVAILKEQTETLNHEAESSEQKASDCKEQLETMLAEIDKVSIE